MNMWGIDGAALDRYITGNYGEDQFRGLDEWEAAAEDVAEGDIEEACEGYRNDCPQAKWEEACSRCNGTGIEMTTGADCNRCGGSGSCFLGCKKNVVNAGGDVVGDITECETWEWLVESKQQNRREREADQDVDR